jgi:hydrogenase nickel incorporation protein HypA/HybF
MHELSLVSALVEQVDELSVRESFERVLEIRLGVGSQSGVEPACVEFCFPEVTRGTRLEGAKLVLARSDGREFRILDMEVF